MACGKAFGAAGALRGPWAGSCRGQGARHGLSGGEKRPRPGDRRRTVKGLLGRGENSSFPSQKD